MSEVLSSSQSRRSRLTRVRRTWRRTQDSTEIRTGPEIASVATASRPFVVIDPPRNGRAHLRVGNSIEYRPNKHRGGGGEVIRYFAALLRFRERRTDKRSVEPQYSRPE